VVEEEEEEEEEIGMVATLSSTLPYLLRPEYMGFKSFWVVSNDFLKGSWSFASVKGAVCGSVHVRLLVNSKVSPVLGEEEEEQALTSSNLGSGRSE
jgi:hypothetical protein